MQITSILTIQVAQRLTALDEQVPGSTHGKTNLVTNFSKFGLGRVFLCNVPEKISLLWYSYTRKFLHQQGEHKAWRAKRNIEARAIGYLIEEDRASISLLTQVAPCASPAHVSVQGSHEKTLQARRDIKIHNKLIELANSSSSSNASRAIMPIFVTTEQNGACLIQQRIFHGSLPSLSLSVTVILSKSQALEVFEFYGS